MGSGVGAGCVWIGGFVGGRGLAGESSDSDATGCRSEQAAATGGRGVSLHGRLGLSRGVCAAGVGPGRGAWLLEGAAVASCDLAE